jgi:hypothetical protein
MATEYIVIQERGVKGADAPTWLRLEYTIPAQWDGTLTLSGNVASDSLGEKQFYINYNGLQYENNYFFITDNVATWNHPYLTLDEGDLISVWYVLAI